MKASELRIGNLVYFKNTHDVAKVELIHNNHFDCRDEYGSFIPNGNYEPIELTEEWLLKFYFTQKLGNWELPNFRFHINKPMNYDGFVFCDGYSVITDKIHYVHQLQNLYFALCGDELELKETL